MQEESDESWEAELRRDMATQPPRRCHFCGETKPRIEFACPDDDPEPECEQCWLDSK